MAVSKIRNKKKKKKIRPRKTAKKNITQAITPAATEATKAVIMAVREQDIPVNNIRPAHKQHQGHTAQLYTNTTLTQRQQTLTRNDATLR